MQDQHGFGTGAGPLSANEKHFELGLSEKTKGQLSHPFASMSLAGSGNKHPSVPYLNSYMGYQRLTVN